MCIRDSMPTERFNKLPEEKKKAIRDAAMEECIRVPFEKVSLNKIIQNAGISRGSFYTYFEDKRDVVRYIFSDTADKLKDFWTTSVVSNGGDLWSASEELLDQAITFSQKGKTFQMLQSLSLIHIEMCIRDRFPDIPEFVFERHLFQLGGFLMQPFFKGNIFIRCHG